MKNTTFMKNTTINFKIFYSICLLSTTLIILLLIITGNIFYKHSMNVETSYAIEKLDYIHDQLDSYLTSVNNYSKTIIVDTLVQSDVAKYNKNKINFNATNQRDLKYEINHIIQSTPFIHSVTLYGLDKSRIVTTEIFPYGLGIKDIDFLDKPQWITRTKYSSTNHSKEIPVLSFIRPFYDFLTGSQLGYVEICIPEYTISTIYKDKLTSHNKIFITNQFGIVESSDGSLTIKSAYPSFNLLQPFSNQKSYYLTKNTIIFFKYFPHLNWYIINEINLYYFLSPIFNVLKLFVIVAFLCILACLIVSHKISKTITSPLYQLIRHIQKIKKGNLTPLMISCNDHDINLLFEAFNSMLISQENLKNDLLNAQKTKDKIFLDLLQQQINPHFLYNTLDNICSLAELDEKEILIDIVMNLSKFYREVLSNGKSYITIREELDITKAYLQIMKIRYINQFDFFIFCDETLLDCSCLKLLLQPIVENSIYHGIKEIDRKGIIKIEISEDQNDPNDILLKIFDNGIGFSKEATDKIGESTLKHFALTNIHKRVQLYYGLPYGLSISSSLNKGCIATIKIRKMR